MFNIFKGILIKMNLLLNLKKIKINTKIIEIINNKP